MRSKSSTSSRRACVALTLVLALVWSTLLIAPTWLVPTAEAASLLYEPFNYVAQSNLGGQGGWANQNSGDEVVVTAESLSYAGLAEPQGNKVEFGGAGADPLRTITSQTSGTVYYSFILKVTDLSAVTSTAGTYIAGLVGSNTTTFGANVFLRRVGTTNTYNIGINRRTTAADTVFDTTAYAANTSYLVVVSYEFVTGTVNDVVKLYVNPSTLGGSAPATATVTAANVGTDLTTVNGFFLRQDSATTTPVLALDELRIATTYAEVTPPDTTAPTVTINQAAGQADPTSASPINFTVTFSEPVTGFDGSDVTLSGTAGATTAIVTGSGTTYNVAVSGMTMSGTVIASIAAGVASDAAGNLNTASTSTDNTVQYNAPNTAPVASASPNPATTNEDTPVTIRLTGTDADDQSLDIIVTDLPDHGTLDQPADTVCSPPGSPANCFRDVIYTPAANYNGTDSFKFKVNDGTVDSPEATVNITINPVADLSVGDVTKAEGNTGTTTTFTFTVSLDAPSASDVTFDIATQDNTATDADNDYEPNSVTGARIIAGQTTYTFDVQVNGDTALEPNETFFVNLSNPTNATISDGQGTGTILNDDGAPAPGQIIISEFRLRGPVPSATPGSGNDQGQLDEFIELYNTTDSDFIVVDSSPLPALASRGWAIVSSDTPTTAKFTIPVGTRIPARGHYLVTNALGYSLSAYAAADTVAPEAGGGPASYNADIPDNAGLALFRTGNPASFAAVLPVGEVNPDQLDAVGFLGSAYFEGTALTPPGGITAALEHSFVRKLTTGLPQDTQNNEADFYFVEVNGAASNGRTAILGAPGPENSQSPVQRNGAIKASLIDGAQPSSAPPNRIRSGQIQPGVPNAFGTLTIRRRFTNTTMQTITRLRFRIVDITTLNSPGYTPNGPQADLRFINSSTSPLNPPPASSSIAIDPAPQVLGTSLEQPPAQANGGGLNSSVGASAVAGTLDMMSIIPGASVDVQFVLGVQQGGSFRFLVNVEALPPPEGVPQENESNSKVGARKATGGKQSPR